MPRRKRPCIKSTLDTLSPRVAVALRAVLRVQLRHRCGGPTGPRRPEDRSRANAGDSRDAVRHDSRQQEQPVLTDRCSSPVHGNGHVAHVKPEGACASRNTNYRRTFFSHIPMKTALIFSICAEASERRSTGHPIGDSATWRRAGPSFQVRQFPSSLVPCPSYRVV